MNATRHNAHCHNAQKNSALHSCLFPSSPHPHSATSEYPLSDIPEAGSETEDEPETGDELETEDVLAGTGETPEELAQGPTMPPRSKARVRWQNVAGSLKHEASGAADASSEEGIAETVFDAQLPQQQQQQQQEEDDRQPSGAEPVHLRPKTLGIPHFESSKAVRGSLFLAEGHSHKVWKWRPKKQRPRLAEVVEMAQKERARASHISEVVQTKPTKRDMRRIAERQRVLMDRLDATRAVLREQNEELAESDEDEEGGGGVASKATPPVLPKPSLKEVSKRITLNLKQQRQQGGDKVHFSDVVSAAVARHREEMRAAPRTPLAPATQGRPPAPPLLRSQKSQAAIPIDRWKNIVKEQRRQMRTGSQEEGGGGATAQPNGRVLTRQVSELGSREDYYGASPLRQRMPGQPEREKESIVNRDSVAIGRETDLQRVKKKAARLKKKVQPPPLERHGEVSSSSSDDNEDCDEGATSLMTPLQQGKRPRQQQPPPPPRLSPRAFPGGLKSRRNEAPLLSPASSSSPRSSSSPARAMADPSDGVATTPSSSVVDTRPSLPGPSAAAPSSSSSAAATPTAPGGSGLANRRLASSPDLYNLRVGVASHPPRLSSAMSSADFSAAIDRQQRATAERGGYGGGGGGGGGGARGRPASTSSSTQQHLGDTWSSRPIGAGSRSLYDRLPRQQSPSTTQPPPPGDDSASQGSLV